MGGEPVHPRPQHPPAGPKGLIVDQGAPYTADDRRYDDRTARLAGTSLGLGAGATVLWLLWGLLTMVTGAAAVVYGVVTLRRARLESRQRRQAWWGIGLGVAGNVALFGFTALILA